MIWETGYTLQNGKYIIQRLLGEGGFGVTYLAIEKHPMLGERKVVIKTPNDNLQNNPNYSNFVDKFIKEGKILYQLLEKHNPYIVRVTDLFKEGHLPCLVMDFIEGKNLFQIVQNRGALPEAEAIKYIQQIGSALQIVHHEKLVHRDAHPGNIIISPNQEAILIDFGIVGDIFSTKINSQIMGHPAFAPTEEVSKGYEVTIDIYSLAASLYYAVTGTIPQRNNYTNELILPKQINPNLSNKVNLAITQAMALQPRNRPQTIEEFLQLLEGISVNHSTPLISVISSDKTVVYPKVKLPKNKFTPKQTQENYWFWLLIIFEAYIMTGYFCGAIEGVIQGAGQWAVVGAVFGALGGAIFGAVGGAVRGAGVTNPELTIAISLSFLVIWFLELVIGRFKRWLNREDIERAIFWALIGGLIGGLIGAIEGSLFWTVFWVVVGAIFGAVGETVNKLVKKLSDVSQSSLIILRTCGVGFALGWIISLLVSGKIPFHLFLLR